MHYLQQYRNYRHLLIKFIIFLAIIITFFSSPAKSITVKDYATIFVNKYNKLTSTTPQSINDFIIKYEQQHKDLLHHAYYSTMSDESKQKLISKISTQYASASSLISKYPAQISNIKKIAQEVNDRYAKILGKKLNFDIYLWSSLVDTDGNAFMINGKPAFAINLRLAATYSLEQLRILLAHEAFHIYQMQNLKKSSTKLSLIQQNLWNEGWATYISSIIYPGMPDWKYVTSYTENENDYKEYAKHLPKILKYIDENLHSNNTECFGKLFSASDEMTAPLPIRSGYYVGFHMAKELAKNKSGFDIANMQAQDYLAQERRLLNNLKNTMID